MVNKKSRGYADGPLPHPSIEKEEEDEGTCSICGPTLQNKEKLFKQWRNTEIRKLIIMYEMLESIGV